MALSECYVKAHFEQTTLLWACLSKADDFMQGWENSMPLDCRQWSSVVQKSGFPAKLKTLFLGKKAFDEDLHNAAQKIVVWREK